MLSSRAAAGPAAPFLTWHPFAGEVRTWSYGAVARDALVAPNASRSRRPCEGAYRGQSSGAGLSWLRA
jgi:hypothetical protein